MASPERQYERIACYLDGQRVRLGPAERRLAEEIRRDELTAAWALDAPRARRAIETARRRLRTGLRRGRRLWWLGRAAAAAVLVAGALCYRPGRAPVPFPVAPVRAAEVLADGPEMPQSETVVQLAMLERQLDRLTDSVRPGGASASQSDEMETLEWELEHTWSLEPAGGFTGVGGPGRTNG